MKMRWVLLAILVSTACGCSLSNKGAAKEGSGQSSTPSARAADSGYEVKITKNGAVLASYNQVGARGKGALYDGQSIQLILASPDNKHVLMIDIQGAKTGVYPSPTDTNAAKSGEARLHFTTEKPPILIPSKGEVKLTEFNEEYCSGSFTATGTDINGAKFSIEGSFSKVQVMKA